jgi:hypothetical protein
LGYLNFLHLQSSEPIQILIDAVKTALTNVNAISSTLESALTSGKDLITPVISSMEGAMQSLYN